MGQRFHAKAQPEWPWSEAGFVTTLTSLIDGHFVNITDGGFLAGMLAPMPLSPSWFIAHELLWWAEDNSGPRLQRAFRSWAKDNRADEIRWSCRSENQRIQRFYRRFAEPCETVFSEILPCASQQ